MAYFIMEEDNKWTGEAAEHWGALRGGVVPGWSATLRSGDESGHACCGAGAFETHIGSGDDPQNPQFGVRAHGVGSVCARATSAAASAVGARRSAAAARERGKQPQNFARN